MIPQPMDPTRKPYFLPNLIKAQFVTIMASKKVHHFYLLKYEILKKYCSLYYKVIYIKDCLIANIKKQNNFLIAK